jgi:hypothetical protein
MDFFFGSCSDGFNSIVFNNTLSISRASIRVAVFLSGSLYGMKSG